MIHLFTDLISPKENMNIGVPIYEQRRYGMLTPAMESQYNMIMDDIHMQHRATREFIPPERKDEKYWFKRVRNNVSARKSRMKRKAMDKVIERKLLALQKENIQLRNELAALNMMYLHRPTDKRTASMVSPNVIKEYNIQKDAIDDKDEEEVIDVSPLDYTRGDDNNNETTVSNSFEECSGRSLDACDSNSLDTCNSGSIGESGINNLDASGSSSRDASCSRLEKHFTSYDSNDSSREDISSNSSGKSEMDDFRGYSMSPLMRENCSPGIHYSGSYSSYIGKHNNGLNIDKLKFPELSPMQGCVRPTPRYMSIPLNTQAMMTFQSEMAIVPYMMMKQMNDTNEGSTIKAVPHKIRIKEKIHSAFTKKNCD